MIILANPFLQFINKRYIFRRLNTTMRNGRSSMAISETKLKIEHSDTVGNVSSVL